MKKLALAVALVSTVAAIASTTMAADVYKVKKAAAPIKADADLKEWTGVAPIAITLEDGGAVKAYSMWDEKNLYFAFTVGDEVQNNTQTGGNIWNGDNVQISLDPFNEKNEGAYDDNDYEFGFALTEEGPDSYAWKLADGVDFDPAAQQFAVVNKNGVTTYEIILPAAQIDPTVLKKGSTFGANVLVNDDDGDGRTFVEWTPGIGATKDPSQYNDFTLVD